MQGQVCVDGRRRRGEITTDANTQRDEQQNLIMDGWVCKVHVTQGKKINKSGLTRQALWHRGRRRGRESTLKTALLDFYSLLCCRSRPLFPIQVTLSVAAVKKYELLFWTHNRRTSGSTLVVPRTTACSSTAEPSDVRYQSFAFNLLTSIEHHFAKKKPTVDRRPGILEVSCIDLHLSPC